VEVLVLDDDDEISVLVRDRELLVGKAPTEELVVDEGMLETTAVVLFSAVEEETLIPGDEEEEGAEEDLVLCVEVAREVEVAEGRLLE
jgi:hypothetical protein